MYIQILDIDTNIIVYENTIATWNRFQIISRHRLGLDSLLGVIDTDPIDSDIEEIPETIFPKALQKILPSQNLNITLDNYTISLTNVTFKFDDNFNKIRFTGEEFI